MTDLLDRLLVAWSLTHDPMIEEAIVRMGRAIARPHGALATKPRAVWHELASAGRAGDLDRLLDAPWPEDGELALARVRSLAAFAPDPRISRKLAIIARHHLTKRRVELHEAIVALLVRAPTPSILPSLDALEAGRGPTFVAVYQPARHAIGTLVTRPADPSLLAEAHAQVGDGRDVAALWAAHAAEPNELQRRVVLADALDLANDPRGELIQLQLAIAEGTTDRRLRARLERLLAAHADDWCGALPMVERSSVRFERGFLVALHSHASGADLERFFDRPEWATVEQLSIAGHDCELAALLRRMPVLRRLTLANTTGLELKRLASTGPFPAIQAVASPTAWTPTRDVFPDLRVAAGYWSRAEVAIAQRAAAELGLDAIVHLRCHVSSIGPQVASRRVGPAETRFDLGGWSARVFRDSDVAEVSLDRTAWPGLGEIRSLPERLVESGIRRIRLYYPRDLRETTQRYIRTLFEPVRSQGIPIANGAPVDLGVIRPVC